MTSVFFWNLIPYHLSRCLCCRDRVSLLPEYPVLRTPAQMHSSQTSLCRPAGHSGFADALLSFSFQPVILPVMKNFCNSQEPQNSNSYWLLGVSYHTPLPVSSSANVLPSYLWFPALSLLAAVYCSHHFIELSFLGGSESFKAETVS